MTQKIRISKIDEVRNRIVLVEFPNDVKVTAILPTLHYLTTTLLLYPP